MHYPIIIGLPQGSLIGPCGFAVFINDLPKVCKGNITIYADDCSLIYVANDDQELRQLITNDLSTVAEWCNVNCLSINLKKTHKVCFKTPNQTDTELNIRHGHNKINQTNSTQFLGVILDEYLVATPHITHLTRKLYQVTGCLRAYKELVNLSTMRILYNSMFISLLQHGFTFWGITRKTKLNSISLAVNRAVRCIAETKKSLEGHKKLNTMTLDSLVKRNMMVFGFKEINSIAPIVVDVKLLDENRAQRAINTKIMLIPYHKRGREELSLAVQIPGVWNTLPTNIRNCQKLDDFKRKLNLYLLSEQQQNPS